MLMHQAAF